MKNKGVILAIDAAWSATEPSGVALLEQAGRQQWQCRAVAPSYAQFLALAKGQPVNWQEKPVGKAPDVQQLLAASSQLLENQQVNLVTVDMPVSNVPITGYRMAEREIARGFSKYGCAAHAPSASRPGKISEAYTDTLAGLGFELGVNNTQPGTLNRLLEVYPHPALMRLMEADYRLEYKAAKTSRYWPDLEVEQRKQKLFYIYKCILAKLAQTITNVPDFLPADFSGQTFSNLKRYEDAIDALVCGWVGIQYLQGKAKAYGDETGAIWVPG